MKNETLLMIDIGIQGIKAIRLMAYSDEIEKKADCTYQLIREHLSKIDQTLSKKGKREKFREVEKCH